jgi:hypothetical protein
VDFPLVTDISERLASRPAEAVAATKFLVKVFSEGAQDHSRQLKALTIAHELLYDRTVKNALIETSGVQEALQTLQKCRKSSSSKGPAVDTIRMFAAEIDRKCFIDLDVGNTRSCQKLAPGQASSKSNAWCSGSDAGEEMWEGRPAVCELIKALSHRRSKHQWTESEDRCCHALQVLQTLSDALQVLSTDLTRLHDEFDCLLDDHDAAASTALRKAMKRIAVLLLAATDLQKEIEEWEQHILDATMAVKGCPNPKRFASFLENVLAALDATHLEVEVLRRTRNDAIARVKMQIEVEGAQGEATAASRHMTLQEFLST